MGQDEWIEAWADGVELASALLSSSGPVKRALHLGAAMGRHRQRGDEYAVAVQTHALNLYRAAVEGEVE
jgi:hypothetical protein